MLKLSVTNHSSLVEILVCQLFVTSFVIAIASVFVHAG